MESETRKFCYWLQGIFEGNPELTELDAEQTKVIKDRLDKVFEHVVTPAQKNSGFNDMTVRC